MSVFDRIAAVPLPAPTAVVGDAERQFVKAIRDALKEYDRATKGVAPRKYIPGINGRPPLDPAVVAAAVAEVKAGMPLRFAAAKHGMSKPTLRRYWLRSQGRKVASR